MARDERKIARVRVHSDLIRDALHLPDDAAILSAHTHEHCTPDSVVIEFIVRSETLMPVMDGASIPVASAWVKMNPADDGKLNPGFYKWQY